MTVTPDQAKMLTTLALAIRPYGAPHWDGPGVMAAVKRVAHMRLADVTRAVTRAAEDDKLDTPAPIGIPSSPCWTDHTLTDRPSREPYDGTFCHVTGQPKDRCRRLWGNDHEHLSALEAEARRSEVDVHRTVEALKAETAVPAGLVSSAVAGGGRVRSSSSRNPAESGSMPTATLGRPRSTWASTGPSFIVFRPLKPDGRRIR